MKDGAVRRGLAWVVCVAWTFASVRAGDPAAGATGGDAVIENSRIRVVLEKAGGEAVLFYKLGGGLHECARIERGPGGTDTSLGCRLMGDRPIVEVEPLAGGAPLVLTYRSGHAILPELFGDDLVLRPGPEGQVLRLPGDHAVLHTIDRGDALLLASWPPAPKEITVHPAKDGGPAFARTEVPCAAPGKVWISVLAGAGIWREADSARFAFSEYRKLDWTPPFPARYRCDLRREGPWGLTDSWMRQPRKDKFWMAFLGNGFPPLVIDGEGTAVRIPRFRPGLSFAANMPAEVRFSGEVLIYPFERETDSRAGATPEGEWTVLDVLRATLGAGWTEALGIAEGVLAVEPFPKGFVFVATCGATGIAEDLFSKGKEKEEAARITRAFADMNRFVRYHRERIEEFVAFAAAWRKTVEEHRRSHPASAELEKAVSDLAPLLLYFPDLFEASRDAIKSPEYCEELTAQAIALIDSGDPERLKKMKELGVAMRTIGGRQDDMLAGYRMTAKALRQRAGQIHAAAGDPAVRELMRDLRGASRSALRTCSPYEEFLFLTAAWLARKQ